MYFKDILIISDNAFLCKEFERLALDLCLKEVSWTFSISPFSDIEMFKSKLDSNVTIKNLKDTNVVDQVCERYDLVFSIHCKQIFPPKLVNTIKCINVHPGYNPINRGWYPQVFAIINNLPIGATIHEIDEELDHGNIIDRKFVDKTNADTSLTLYNKVITAEIELLKENLVNILENNFETVIPENNNNNIFLKKDFNELCEIDLNRNYKAGNLINLLRALTHGEYSNAFFIDPNTNKKIFLKIQLEEE
ncbi:dTDP-4-amino-4,6-dideoxyglucose formyltransferase [Tenacibaculum halocynthiae]|uniref:dTDP-4-amino-4,6-dideoxyglucose formyltransferase n=1 Tax=Tenacibaculum halocynthiae TaxID=1254437 RepID=UPI0038942B57